MMDIKALDTARHEAGHAVMHVFLGLENLDDVHIIPSDDSVDGVEFRSIGAVSARRFAFGFSKEKSGFGYSARLDCRKYILVAWAGPESGLRTPRLVATDLQLAEVSAKCVTQKHRKLIAVYQLRARGIIRRRLTPAIEAFAKILLKRKRIEGREAEEIILRLLKINRGHEWALRVAGKFGRRNNRR